MKRVLVLAVLLSGCSLVNAGRQSSGVDACAPSLPVGKTVAGQNATLSSVRRLTPQQANEILARTGAPALVRPMAPPTPLPTVGDTAPTPGATETPTAPGTARVCLLVYTGSFSKDELPADPTPTGEVKGRGLLVVVTARHSRLVAVSVLTSADVAR